MDSPFPLEVLWRSQLDVLITNLSTEIDQHRQIANLAEHIGADYQGRFLIELLQNANDQASLAGLSNANVVATRTHNWVCVTNEGLPFDPKGFRSITSLGLSPKDPRFTIGNKGVGFKAVFQVSDKPRILSAASQEQSFAHPDAGAFSFDDQPLSNPQVRKQLETLILDLLQQQPDRILKLEKRFPGQSAFEAVLKGVRTSASFCYPVPLDAEERQALLHQTSLDERASRAQTLIFLPLRCSGGQVDKRVTQVVDEAFRELLAQSSKTVLFLRGVRTLLIDDRVNGTRHCIERSQTSEPMVLARGSRLHELETRELREHDSSVPSRRTAWLVTERILGQDHESFPNRGASERQQIAHAVEHLPGKNWKKVEQVPVSVAIRLPSTNELPGKLLGAEEFFFIGLPTQVRTGTPFLVDASFHGTLSRTSINLEAPYNRLLFDEAVVLVGDLIEVLRVHPDIRFRRLVTLAMQRSHVEFQAPLSERLHAPGGLATSDVVLARDGQHFLHARELQLPAEADEEWLWKFIQQGGDPKPHGFGLPDEALLREARPLLCSLPGFQPLQQRYPFLQRPGGTPSILEVLAEKHRADGPSFWEPFLSWVLDSAFGNASLLAAQRILPVGESDRAAASERIFHRPWSRPRDGGPSTPPEEVSAPSAKEENPGEAEEEIGEFPAGLVHHLRFLDDRAVQVRRHGSRNLTPLGRRLSAPREGLVRPPRKASLINDAIIPALAKLTHDPDRVHAAVELLRLALTWMEQIPPENEHYKSLKLQGLLVPVLNASQGRTLLPPDQLYFGPGWLDGEDAQKLARVHGNAPGRVLLPWEEFIRLLPSDSEPSSTRAFWKKWLFRLGVADSPRVMVEKPLAPAFRVSYHRLEAEPLAAPWPELAGLFKEYLNHCAQKAFSNYQRGFYLLDRISWIEGLEREDAREAVFDLILKNSHKYELYLHDNIERTTRYESFSVPSFWSWAIRQQPWSIIPTVQGLRCTAGRAWRMERELRRDHSRLRLLPTVDAPDEAVRLLDALEIKSPDTASFARLASGLHEIAAQLPLTGQHERAARALSADLYRRLAHAYAKDKTVRVGVLSDSKVPLIVNDSLVAVEEGHIRHVYVDDDPVRRGFLTNTSEACFVPLNRDSPHQATEEVFAAWLGAARVTRTSKAPIKPVFTEVESVQRPLIEELESHYSQVTLDIATLIAYGGRNPMGPRGETFFRTWEQFRTARLVRVSFAPPFRHRAYPETTSQPWRLYVDATLSFPQILAEAWGLIGIDHRDVLSAFAAIISSKREEVERFFDVRHIGIPERHEVEGVIGGGFRFFADHLRPVFLALFHRAFPQESLKRFDQEWPKRSERIESLVSWLGTPKLAELLSELQASHRDVAAERLVSATGLDWESFRAALAELGLTDWRFTASVERFAQWRGHLRAYLMAAAARGASVDLGEAQQLLEALASWEIPPSLAQLPPDDLACLQFLVRQALEFISTRGLNQLTLLTSRLNQLGELPSAPADLTPYEPQAGQREIKTYEHDTPEDRRRSATKLLADYLRIIQALAPTLGEAEACAPLATQPSLQALADGFFANRFSLLAGISAKLAELAPKTQARLSALRAFNEPHTWDNLWVKLTELGPLPTPQVTRPPSSRTLLETSLPDNEIDGDLRQGSHGKLGLKLQALANQAGAADFQALRTRPHGRATPPSRPKKNASKPAKTPQPPMNARDRELLGLMGEAFVYEYLRTRLPGFDASCWVSENAERYGLGLPPQVGAGADFRYLDVNGELAGRPNTVCWLEVKSSKGDGSAPFAITASEWAKAVECHENTSGSQRYIIVRVAHVDQNPVLLDLLFDPVQLQKEGALAFADQDFWVYVGAVNPP